MNTRAVDRDKRVTHVYFQTAADKARCMRAARRAHMSLSRFVAVAALEKAKASENSK